MEIVDMGNFGVLDRDWNLESFDQFLPDEVTYGPDGVYFLVKSPYTERTDHIFHRGPHVSGRNSMYGASVSPFPAKVLSYGPSVKSFLCTL